MVQLKSSMQKIREPSLQFALMDLARPSIDLIGGLRRSPRGTYRRRNA